MAIHLRACGIAYPALLDEELDAELGPLDAEDAEDSDAEDAITNTEPLDNPDEESPMKPMGTRMDDKAEQETGANRLITDDWFP